MRQITVVDTLTIPATAASVTRDSFIGWKLIPAGLVAVLTDLSGAFSELFFLIFILWACDLTLGLARAISDPTVKMEWIKFFRSLVKLFVIAIGVVAIRAIEALIVYSGIDTQEKFTVAMLIAVGIALAFSCLDNLSYFWPGLEGLFDRIKSLLGKAKPTEASHPDRRSGDS